MFNCCSVHKHLLHLLVSKKAWSILYHSLLTLVLLVWACLIWVLPKSRTWCLRSSPLFVLYSVVLLGLEFVYGLQLLPAELPEYKSIGLVRHDVPVLQLAIKNFLLLSFWLTMRQYIGERRRRQEQQMREMMQLSQQEPGVSSIGGIGGIGGGDTSTSSGATFEALASPSASPVAKMSLQTRMIAWIYAFLVKYWIFLTSGTLLLMSCQQPVVAFRIGYWMLFLYFITCFQLAYSFWRSTLYVFHSVIVIYSMSVLLLIYIFQFDDVPAYFERLFGIDEQVLAAIGFDKLRKEELVVRLLTPTTFLIVNILQIHYFNKPWLKLTDIRELRRVKVLQQQQQQQQQQQESNLFAEQNNNNNNNSSKNSNESSENSNSNSNSESSNSNSSNNNKESFALFVVRMARTVKRYYSMLLIHLWRFAEIHVFHVILIVIAVFCFRHVSVCCVRPMAFDTFVAAFFCPANLLIALSREQITLLNMILMCSMLFTLMAGRSSDEKHIIRIFSGFVQIWVAVITTCAMIFNLDFVKSPLVYTCVNIISMHNAQIIFISLLS